MGQIKNIKLLIVTDIKIHLQKMTSKVKREMKMETNTEETKTNNIKDGIKKIKTTTTTTTTDADKLPFKKAQVKLAVSALFAHLNDPEHSAQKKDELFAADQAMWLVLGLKKIPPLEKKPRKIALPHTYMSTSEVCLITKDPGKVVKQKLEEQGVTNVTKVISLTKLRKEHSTFTLKRQLCATYDMFLCDDRIYHFAVKTLGKEFFKRRKEPIPIRLTYKDWKTEISKSLNCALLRLGHGPCSTVKVGNIDQGEQELTENAVHLMKMIGGKIPGSWKNVASFHVKSSSSVALPVYQSSPLVDIPMDALATTKTK